MDNKKELIERVLLLMKYDNRKTLNENVKIISEQIPNQRLNSSDNVAQGISQPNYKTGNDYCNRGTVKDFQWVANSQGKDTFQGKKGYCRLSDKKQNTLFNSLGVTSSLKPNEGAFRVLNQDQWYSVYALFLAQEIEFYKGRNIWNDDPNGYCKGTGVLSMMVRDNNKDISLQDAFEDKVKRRLVCYNDKIAVYKPYDKIDFDNLVSSSGRLSKSSVKRYDGYIPSYADVVKAYGYAGNYTNILKALDQYKDNFSSLANITNRGEKLATKPTTGNVHDVLSLLQIVSVVIPVAGPFISLGLGLVDSGVYYAEGETNMAALTLGLSILFDLPILKAGFGNIGKQAISNLTDEEIVQMSKALLENNTKNLPKNLDEILKSVKIEMGKNPSVRKQYEQTIKEKSTEILSNKNIVGKLSPNSKTALSQASKGQLAGKVFAAGTVGVGLPLTAKGGYETVKPLIRGNIKTQVEAEGYKWDVVKKMFGSNGSAEDNQKLLEAWLLKWRPGLEVPQKYQTETYKQNQKAEMEKIAQELSKTFGLDEPEKMKSIDAKTLTPFMSSLTNPEIISTRDSLENTYDDYGKFLDDNE